MKVNTYQDFPDDFDARNVYEGSFNKACDSEGIDCCKYLILIQATTSTLLAWNAFDIFLRLSGSL